MATTPAKSATACEFWDWLLYLVRLHRHIYVREFCPRRLAVHGRRHGTWICLFRLLALNHNDAAGRPNGRLVWNASDLLGSTGACGARSAACSVAQFGSRTGRTCPHRHWDVLRTGNRNRLCGTCRDLEPRRRQWSLSGVIFLRWLGRQRGPGSALRSAWVGRLRCRYRRGACRSGDVGPSPRNLGGFRNTRILVQEDRYVFDARPAILFLNAAAGPCARYSQRHGGDRAPCRKAAESCWIARCQSGIRGTSAAGEGYGSL